MSLSTRKSLSIDHLGLVAAMYDELGIGETIDTAIKQDMNKRILSIGQAVKAMVLNGLGFVNQNLYLAPYFFEKKPVSALIGKNIEPEHINDDTLGRALDALYDQGVTELFYTIASKSIQRLDLAPTFAHLDSTSFHVDGEYKTAYGQAQGVHITQGYSRDHRPDLKQVVLNLIVENQAGIPLLMKPADGNSQDKKGFRELIDGHIDQLKQGSSVDYLVADSALYTEDTLKLLSSFATHWVTRVPETIKEAQEVIAKTYRQEMRPLTEGYRYFPYKSAYADVNQRWCVIHSQAACKRSRHTLTKRFLRESEKELKAFTQLCKTEFACEQDAKNSLTKHQRRLKYLDLQAEVISKSGYSKPGRPKPGQAPDRHYFLIRGHASMSIESYHKALHQKSCFIVATNQMDTGTLCDQDLLGVYKGQGKVEKGFRFLKDPMFLSDALFLKNSHRIVALMMVMTLCLMVYAALEYRIRLGLKKSDQGFPSQTGKLIQNPTARWVFSYFYGIHIWISADEERIVVNLDDYHWLILKLLGNQYQYYYS